MIKQSILIFGLFALAICGCGGEDNEAAEESVTAPAESPAPSNTVGDNPNSVENLPWTFLVDGVYHNNVTVSAGSGAKNNENKGHWIDFKENGTYEYGIWGDKQYDGTWFYDGNTNILDLTPKGDNSPSQWRVMHKDDNLIWMGTSKYGNNATQIQWLRNKDYPSKTD